MAGQINQLSLQAALLFIILAAPATFRLTDGIFGKLLNMRLHEGGQPTKIGLLLHAVVMYILFTLFVKA